MKSIISSFTRLLPSLRTIHLLILAYLSIYSTYAQTNYYKEDKTFQENGYTYQCDVVGGLVTLYNSQNKWTYVEQMKKGTNTPFYIKAEDYAKTPTIIKNEYSVYIDSIYKVIVNKAFGSYKGTMKGSKLIIVTAISSETGEISELYFEFGNHTPYATVPVSVYREIETKLVGLKYTLTPLARTLNYVFQWWAIEPK